MHSIVRTVLVGVVALISVISFRTTEVAAQGNAPKCDPRSVVAEANKLQSTGNNDTDLNQLLKLSADINTMNVACSGMSFHSRSETLIGPVSLPRGLYKTTLITTGSFTAEIKLIQGGCSTNGINDTILYNLEPGEATISSEALLISFDCELVIQVGKVTSPWQLTITPLKPS